MRVSNCVDVLEGRIQPLSRLGLLKPQYNIFSGRYRLDFALLGRNWKIAIECNGLDFHSSRKQILADDKRNLALMCDGWKVLRFWGWQINTDIDGCIRDVAKLARTVRR